MNITQRIEQRQAQTLVMTPQLQQAIKLLQMSNLELGDYIEQELEKNPLLERADAALAPGAASTQASSNTPANTGGDAYSPYTGQASPASSANGFADDGALFLQNIAEKPTLRAHLMEQVNLDFTDLHQRLIACTLVEALDDAGYLPADLTSIQSHLGATPEQMEAVIAKAQRFDPCGIFARSLHECLSIQLREKNRLDPAMRALLRNLDLLAKRETAALMRICGVSAEDLADMIAELRRLNPKPATAFASDPAPPIVPDVFLRPLQNGGWHVELNTETLPRVLANERYYARIHASAARKEDKDYIVDHWQRANWLVKAMHQRATTILKVASEIIRQQESFFTHGVHRLRPLILKDIATAVEMHESTVSRVTQNKFIATPRGIFELKYFFTPALARSDGGDDMSSEAVRARIKALIEGEKPSFILSDDHLSMRLRGEGIDVARRTVAKYREAMKIPTSAQRRREKRSTFP